MNELNELSQALAGYQKALAELEAALKDVRKTVFGASDEPFPYYDPSEPEPDDEELEARAENRCAYRKPYDWMTELED
jgi:hypothetical protein